MTKPPFERVLVANRGEIAVRVCRTLKEMGIQPVTIHSDVDADSPHVLAAPTAINIGGHDAGSSYLQVPQLLEAAFDCDAQAVHPGYGFLSEDADFARALEAVGLTFIGPTPEAMEILGSKQQAKEAATAAGVPVVPGFSQDSGDDELMLAEARELRFPVLIKASGGGGGKGMRVVEHESDFADSIAACRREARSAFRDATMMLEKLIFPARHVEVQILGDSHGNVVALNERDCSVQRRHQKVVEEAPAPGVSEDLRQRMCEAAVKLAKQVGYRNAGTVEFLLDENGDFHFLETNTRLQVEHPVTEMTTGLDLVKLQVLIAAGESLEDLLRDRDIRPRGHAIEVRVYAECPEDGYLPAAGTLHQVIEPRGPGVRVDSGVHSGTEIGVHFDPMLSKIIVYGQDRDTACRRMAQALRETAYLGIPTNLDFLARIIESQDFRGANLRTDFLELHPEVVNGPGDPPPDIAYIAAALSATLGSGNGRGGGRGANHGRSIGTTTGHERPDVWDSLGPVRLWEGQ
ncbi:MAG: acetyl-CoA carboxylase biotin carboxylase subunit [Planctomycetota bacterium]|jgi:acetyl/propionyl-CoA carboxylase alpha subunit